MSVLDYLAGTARMIGVNLESALVQPTLPRTSERAGAMQPDAGTREGVAAFYQERAQELDQARRHLSNARAKYNRYAFGLGLALAIPHVWDSVASAAGGGAGRSAIGSGSHLRPKLNTVQGTR